jgi:hypothetical protein
MPPGDPAPIRGRYWLVYDLRSPFHDVEIVAEESALRGYLERGGRVEGPFVPVPDEAAIERGAKALFGEVYPDSNFDGDWRADECREQALVVLRAALEAPEKPS